jgi:hypothetical protein
MRARAPLLGIFLFSRVLGSGPTALAAEPSDAGAPAASAADPRLTIACALGPVGRPSPLRDSEKVSNGIVYEERVTADETRLELAWRHLAVAGRSGRSLVPTDLEACRPLLADEDGAVVLCRHPEAGEGAAPTQRLIRLRAGKPPVRLAESLALPGKVHLHPLGGGRLLAWIERADSARPEESSDEVTAAEIDPKGVVVRYAIVSPPYLRRWPAGHAFVLLKQAPVASSAPSTYWRAEWDAAAHRLAFRSEPARGRLPACQGAAKAADVAVARLLLPQRPPWTAVVTVGQGSSGPCVSAAATDAPPGEGGVAELHAEGGRLRGHLWTVKPAPRRPGTRAVLQVTPAEVSCELRSPG